MLHTECKQYLCGINIIFLNVNCSINKVMGPVPKHSTFWDRSHVMRDRSRLYGTSTPRTHSLLMPFVIIRASPDVAFLCFLVEDCHLLSYSLYYHCYLVLLLYGPIVLFALENEEWLAVTGTQDHKMDLLLLS